MLNDYENDMIGFILKSEDDPESINNILDKSIDELKDKIEDLEKEYSEILRTGKVEYNTHKRSNEKEHILVQIRDAECRISKYECKIKEIRSRTIHSEYFHYLVENLIDKYLGCIYRLKEKVFDLKDELKINDNKNYFDERILSIRNTVMELSKEIYDIILNKIKINTERTEIAGDYERNKDLLEDCIVND